MYAGSTYDEFEDKAYSLPLHTHIIHFIMKDIPTTPPKRFPTNQLCPRKANNHNIDMDSDDSESYGLSSNSTNSESTELLNEIGRLKQNWPGWKVFCPTMMNCSIFTFYKMEVNYSIKGTKVFFLRTNYSL